MVGRDFCRALDTYSLYHHGIYLSMKVYMLGRGCSRALDNLASQAEAGRDKGIIYIGNHF